MFELLALVLYCWLFVVVGKALLKMAWGLTKLLAGLLLILSFPSLVGVFLLASGLVLLAPAGLLVIAILLLSRCA